MEAKKRLITRNKAKAAKWKHANGAKLQGFISKGIKVPVIIGKD